MWVAKKDINLTGRSNYQAATFWAVLKQNSKDKNIIWIINALYWNFFGQENPHDLNNPLWYLMIYFICICSGIRQLDTFKGPG